MTSFKYRCPFCPDRFHDLDVYRVHFERLHATNRMTGQKVPYTDPDPYTPPPRVPKRSSDDGEPLFFHDI